MSGRQQGRFLPVGAPHTAVKSECEGGEFDAESALRMAGTLPDNVPSLKKARCSIPNLTRTEQSFSQISADHKSDTTVHQCRPIEMLKTCPSTAFTAGQEGFTYELVETYLKPTLEAMCKDAPQKTVTFEWYLPPSSSDLESATSAFNILCNGDFTNTNLDYLTTPVFTFLLHAANVMRHVLRDAQHLQHTMEQVQTPEMSAMLWAILPVQALALMLYHCVSAKCVSLG
eukprot:60307-Hanusia_phi.AAC.4